MATIQIGADHAGFELKEKIKFYLQKEFNEVEDHGTFASDSVDYPDYAHPTAEAVEKENGLGILICGSANGVCITANKHQGIRAALCWNVEVAKLARQHNNANILCIPARFVTNEVAIQRVEAFLNTHFEGGRHQQRVSKISTQ